MKDTFRYVIDWDGKVAIKNGSYDLKLASSSLLALCEALDCKDFKPDKEQMYAAIMLAVRTIENVYLDLDKIEVKELNNNDQA